MAAGWVQMKCRECAAELAVTARVCSRCGAPIVGQLPVVADAAVADTVVGAVSDAAGQGVAAGVARQASAEPYVPGSGAGLPAELRLVLAGFIGLACGLFASALASATAIVFLAAGLAQDDNKYICGGCLVDTDGLLFGLVVAAFTLGAFLWAAAGVVYGVQALKARIRFSRLLRRPSDPHTATVTASKRGGRTLILDIIPRDDTGRAYQSLSAVRLALRTKADMLVPCETVNVYGGSDGKSDLLINSPQRGRAFLGTVESKSALQPRLLDEKVSGVILLDWAAWAASTTFSTGRGFGYETRQVDAFRSAVRDAFLGGSEPVVRSGDVRGKQFSTHKRGYDETQVDAFVEAAGLRLAAMDSTDSPAGPLVSGAILFGWAEWVDSATFETHPEAYDMAEVDAFTQEIRDAFLGASESPVTAQNVRGKQFSSTDADDLGYDKSQVDAFLDAAGIRLAAMESTDRVGPLIGAAILAAWAEWADSTRFSTTPRLWKGYATAEVDTFREELRDTFLGVSLGVRQPPLTWDDVHRKWPGGGIPPFSTTRGWSRPGYDMQEVDAFLNMTKLRLAAIRRINRPGIRIYVRPWD